MIVRQLEITLAAITPHSAGTLDHVARALRTAGLIPNAGRGGNAPDITPQQAGSFLLGLAASASPQQAGVKAAEYAALSAAPSRFLASDGKPPPVGEFAGCSALGEAMQAILGSQELAHSIEEVRVYRSWPLVAIKTKGGDTYVYGHTTHEAARSAGYHSGLAAVVCILEGGLLHQLAIDIAEEDEDDTGEWVAG